MQYSIFLNTVKKFFLIFACALLSSQNTPGARGKAFAKQSGKANKLTQKIVTESDLPIETLPPAKAPSSIRSFVKNMAYSSLGAYSASYLAAWQSNHSPLLGRGPLNRVHPASIALSNMSTLAISRISGGKAYDHEGAFRHYMHQVLGTHPTSS